MHPTLLAGWIAVGVASLAPSGHPPGSSPAHPAPVAYELDLTVDYRGGRIDGTATVTVANRSDGPLSELPLLLNRSLGVASVVDGSGASLDFSQEVRGFEELPALRVNAVTVRLPGPPRSGEHGVVSVTYGGRISDYAEILPYVQDRVAPEFTILRMDAFAYPVVGPPSFRSLRSAPSAPYRYLAGVRVPRTAERRGGPRGSDRPTAGDVEFTPVVANGGRLVSRTDDGDHVVWRYESRRPSWRMDFAIADYGVLESGDDRVYGLPGDSTGALRILASLGAARRLFTERFGSLVEPTGYAVIEFPEDMGSQADVTSIVQTAAAFRDPERVVELYHEVSHLWHPAPIDRPSPRWNEGLATFLQYQAAEELNGRQVLEEQVNATLSHLQARLDASETLRTVPMRRYGVEDLTDLSYHVGLVMFELIHEIVGRDSFDRIVGEFYRRHARFGGSTEDFVRLAIAIGGMPVAKVVEDWLLTTAWTDTVGAGADRAAILRRYSYGALDTSFRKRDR